MSTPEIWKVLEKLCLHFKAKSYFPYNIFVLRQEMEMLPISRKDELGMKASSLAVLTHTIYCFLCLFWYFIKSNKGNSIEDALELSITEILSLLICMLLPSSFLAIHFALSFTPEIFPQIINTMARFENRVTCKYPIIF